MPKISVNRNAFKLVKKLCDNPDDYGVTVETAETGTYLIDAGIESTGGFLAGKIITEICLGGLGEVTLSSMRIGRTVLPSISVFTDHPAIATLGSQLAGWRVKAAKYAAVGSGPARALALKPKSVFRKIAYKDESNVAVLVLETSKKPGKETVMNIAETCGVNPENLYLVLAPTASVAGFTQISGRTAETGIHKLTELGFNPQLITHAWGCAPILPVHPDAVEAMGRSNDAILYGGVAYYVVNYDDDEKLRDLAEKSVSQSSEQYGRPFAEIFEEADRDFYKIDPGIFAPAVVTINNARTGRTFTAGEINTDVLLKSIQVEKEN